MVVSVDTDVAILFSSSSSSWFVILVVMVVIAYDGSLFNTSSRLSMALLYILIHFLTEKQIGVINN